MISINGILARYQSGFGYVAANVAEIAANRLWAKFASKYIAQYTKSQPSTGGDEAIQLYTVDESHFSDMLFTNLKSGNKYGFGSYSLAAAIDLYNTENKYLAPPPMVTFSRGKNVVRTAIDRSEDEVIEYFGLKPWTIKLQGILIDLGEHHYPQALVKKVNQMFSEWGTYKIEGSLFLDLGITEVFFDNDFEISFVEGYADTVKFSVSAISTKPTELVAIGY